MTYSMSCLASMQSFLRGRFGSCEVGCVVFPIGNICSKAWFGVHNFMSAVVHELDLMSTVSWTVEVQGCGEQVGKN